MKLTFLGTGTSQGVPIIACDCKVCKSPDKKDKRLRSSVLISEGSTNILIDSGPDFREQMLRENIKHIDAILYTHEHRDHLAGLDDVRSFTNITGKEMPIYSSERVLETIKTVNPYIFAKYKYPGIPKIELNEINNKPFTINKTVITPINVLHYKLPILGFRFANLAYITDANYIPDNEIEKLKNLDCLIINALHHEKHISHFNLKEAIEVIKKVNPKIAFLTHIGHNMGLYEEEEKKLPPDIHLAYDGLKVEIE